MPVDEVVAEFVGDGAHAAPAVGLIEDPDAPDDPFAPPTERQLLELRDRCLSVWVEVLRKMAVAERERIKNEASHKKLVPRDQVEREREAKLAAIQTALHQVRRVLTPWIIELVREHFRPLTTKKKARELDRVCARLESHIDQVLEEAFNTISQAYEGNEQP